MNKEFEVMQKKISDLWNIDESDTEINQTYYDLEMELLDLFSFNDGHSEPMKQLEVLRKELNRFKNERDLYDEASELDMMFPNGQDY